MGKGCEPGPNHAGEPPLRVRFGPLAGIAKFRVVEDLFPVGLLAEGTTLCCPSSGAILRPPKSQQSFRHP